MAKRRGNGEGSITRHNKSGLFMARYMVHTAHGPKRKTIYGKTRKEVAHKLHKALNECADGFVCDDANITVGEYLDKWLSDSVRGSVRKSTYDRRESDVRVHIKPALGKVKLAKLSPMHLQGFYRDKLDSGLAPATVNKIHSVIHHALEQANKWDLIPRNVAKAVTAPRPTPEEEMSPLSAEETRRFLKAACGDKLEALYVLAIHTGMREGELLGLRWTDVDLENGKLSVRHTLTRDGGKVELGETKTPNSRRTIYLTRPAVEALKKHLQRQLKEIEALGDLYQDNGLVFANEVGNPINPSNFRQRYFYKLLKKAGVPKIRFHDLRHTCATLLFQQGTHPKYVQELLGHANIKITLDTYSHVIPGMGDHTAKAMENALLE